MEKIRIATIDNNLKDLGIEQEDVYTDFYFNRKDLIGYWVSDDNDGEPYEIVVYVGAHKFIVQYNEETIDQLTKILNENSRL